MFDHPTATFPLGLELDGEFLRGALLTYQRGSPIIERLFTAPIESSPQEGASCTLNPLQTISPPLPRDRMRRALFITGLSTEETLIRPLEVKLTKVKDIDAVLEFQAEPLIPYPVENAVIRRWILGVQEGSSLLSILSIRKDHLEHHLSFYDSLKMEPEVVSTYPAGLAAFAKTFAGVKEPLFLIHLAHKTISCLLAENGKVLASHAIPTGAFFSTIAALSPEKRDQLQFQTLPPELATLFDPLRQSIIRAIFALTKQAKDAKLLLVTGPGASLGSLSAHLAETLKKELVPLKTLPQFSSSALLTHALPIGLASTALPLEGSADQINFRGGDFSYSNPWRRLKKPLALYISSTVLLALALVTLTNATISRRELRVKEQYAQLLNAMEKNHVSFELEMEGKTPSKELMSAPPKIALKNLSLDQLNARLFKLSQEITSTPDVFPLQPDVPRVSDVLAWLSSHTKAVKGEGSASRTGLVRIEGFNYSMTRRPDKTKPQERYQVKVDLEFTSPDSKSAREFYDALVEPNAFVDPQSEVSWSAGLGKYRVSFYLKDKTSYP